MKSSRGEQRARQSFVLAATAAVLCFTLIGCSTIAPPVSPAPEPVPSVGLDSADLVQLLEQRLAQFRSLRSLASISYSGKEGRRGFQEAVVVQRPDHLRLETLSLLGAILIVTVDGGEVSGLHPREALFFRGKSSKENLFRYTHVPLEIHELTLLLMGLPPVDMQGRWEKEGAGNAIARERTEGGKDRVAFDSRLVPIQWERTQENGAVELRATFADFSSVPAGLFPAKISVEAPAQQRGVEIHYQEPELNVSLPSDLFVQQKPANAKELPIESLGR